VADLSYIEALMRAPSREENDITAKEAARRKAQELQQMMKDFVRSWRVMQHWTRSLRRRGVDLALHLGPDLAQKLLARRRLINHKRARIARRKMGIA
jgi:hypothetical protein